MKLMTRTRRLAAWQKTLSPPRGSRGKNSNFHKGEGLDRLTGPASTRKTLSLTKPGGMQSSRYTHILLTQCAARFFGVWFKQGHPRPSSSRGDNSGVGLPFIFRGNMPRQSQKQSTKYARIPPANNQKQF